MSATHIHKIVNPGKIESVDHCRYCTGAEAGHCIMESLAFVGILFEPGKPRHAEFVWEGGLSHFN